MATDKLKAKIWMKKAQADARAIMKESNKIWEIAGWKSGSDVNQFLLQRMLKQKFGEKKFNPVVAEILEDANYHSSLQALEEMGLVKYKGNLLTKYRKLGGKTWEL